MEIKTQFSMERAKTDVKFFYRWLGYTWGTHIGEWMEMYSDRQGAQVHRVCLIAPRGHSKSTTLRVKLLHHCLFDKHNNKPFSIWLFSASKDTASRRLEEVREDIKQHPQLSRYLDRTRGNKLEIYFTNGSWIRATSVGSAIRGEHPACVAFDDVLDDMGDISMKNLRHWFQKKVTPMLDPGTWFYVIGTPMAMTDLYHTEMLNNEAWKTGTWSAIENWDEWRSDPDGVKPIELWPEYRNIEYLLEQKAAMGDLSFIQEFLCRVVDDEAAVFPRALTRKHLDMDSVLEWGKDYPQGRYSIGFDPAHGLGQDYSVMVVLRQDDDGDIHFVNMWRRNDFPPDKQADVVVDWLKRYGNPPFAAEDVGFQQMYENLLRQKGAVPDYRKSKVSNRTLKQGLLNRLRVWFEQERVVFPFGSDDTRKIVNIMLEEFESHAWRDGLIVDLGKHNDCVMAFAHAIDQFQIPEIGIPVVMKSMKTGEWTTGKGNRKNLPNRGTGSGIGGKVINRRPNKNLWE